MLAPSLLAADASQWGEEIRIIAEEGITSIHLDIMDGRFVPNLTYGPGPVAMLRKCTTMDFDAHLMVVEPERLIPAFVEAGVNSITVHAEACLHLHRILESIREAGLRCGVAINPGTPVCQIAPVLPFVDRVLVMTVNPGFGGQKAIPSALEKVGELRQLREAKAYTFEIQADGGIHQGNILTFLACGVENLVIGSALFQPGKTRENCRAFRKLIGEAMEK